MDSASDESLRNEGRQVEGRERRSIHVIRVKPASHVSEYQVSCVKCQVAHSAMAAKALISGVKFQEIEINIVLIKAYNATNYLVG